MPSPPLDPAALELLRSQSGLSIDLEGRLCHAGVPITHERTLEVLWASLAREPDGRYAVRVGPEMGYVTPLDAPYAVRGVTFDAPPVLPLLHLSDRTTERLDPGTLWLDGDGVLHCKVRGGAHAARFTRAGQIALGLALEDDPRRPGHYLLRLGEAEFPIAGP